MRTERLLLSPFSEKNLTDRYISWLNDPDVVKYSENRHKKHTMASCCQYLESYKDSPGYFWAITLMGTGEHIGNINASVDQNNSIADIGIIIGEKKNWGQGYGTEAWEKVISFLLNDAKIRKVTAGAMSGNAGMIKIMENSGMRSDGIRARHYLLDGTEVDIIRMAVFRDK